MPETIGPRTQFVICLAGHIDHGKSSIVQALTGGRVDRLPEEQRRGITIDLGFSHFDVDGCRYALIDVPGHERFIHTMVAGASGVDAALLVVAADDSVMPQTREHLALLEMLGVRSGVIALSKCDLADAEQLEILDMEVAELVAPTFLATAPRIQISAQDGRGIEELRAALVAAARQAPRRPTSDKRFRMPIDRAFSPTGQGAVVTGTVWRGAAHVGDTLHLLPDATPVRIRRMQSQGKDVDRVVAGERAAINLAGVKATAIHRGDELATPDAFVPATRHLVEVQLLANAGVTLRHRQSVRVHLGANQATAQIALGQKELAPGETAFGILRCKMPIVAEYGQPFVVRQLSPALTIGGGRIVSPALKPGDRLVRTLAAAAGLSSATPAERLAAYIALRRETTLDDASESWIGLTREECEAVLPELIKQRRIVRVTGTPPWYLTAERFQKIKQQVVRSCQVELERRKPASRVPLPVILSAMSHRTHPTVLQAVLDEMTARRELVRNNERVGLPSGASLSNKQRQMLAALLSELQQTGPTPPFLKEFAERHNYPLKDLEQIVQVGVDDGEIVRLTPQMAITPVALERLRQNLADYFRDRAMATTSEIREHWGITRKHAVPLLEYFDQLQITTRTGDARTAGPRLALPLDEPGS